jgi:hypothetical protein
MGRENSFEYEARMEEWEKGGNAQDMRWSHEGSAGNGVANEGQTEVFEYVTLSLRSDPTGA